MRASRLVRGLLTAPRMENVIALLLLVFLSWVQGAGATERPSRHPRRAEVSDGMRAGRTSGSCASSEECAWGYACDAGVCAEAPCHGAKRVGGRVLAARRCGAAAVCSYAGEGASRAHGVGVCVVR